jgi:hypothetical protein
MHIASASATWGRRSTSAEPFKPSEVTVGSTSAAEDDAISTAYSGACGTPITCATPYARRTATTPTTTALTTPVRSAVRIRSSRTGTWVPATNITSTKPALPRKVKVGALASRTPKPVTPSTTPASSSPSTTGRCQRSGAASRGPARATAHTIARSRNDTSEG